MLVFSVASLGAQVTAQLAPKPMKAPGVRVQKKNYWTRMATKERERKSNKENNYHKQSKSHARYRRKAVKFQWRIATEVCAGLFQTGALPLSAV